jgi:hypothetical protein
MKKLFLTLGLLFFFTAVFSQENSDYKLWSSTHPLTVNDLGIKKSNTGADLCFAQFNMQYSVKGFDFLTKNFNKKVQTFFIRSGSWINPSDNVEYSLRYQQTLFDLYELYTRKFRKELRENRKQFLKGLAFVQEINSKITADLSRRRLQYESETRSGRDGEKQSLWEQQIQKELDDLAEFDYNR